MPFTMLLPAINVFLPFRTASLYLLFPSTMLCCQKGLLLSGKWVMTGLGRWFCLLYTGVWWRYCNVSLSIHLEGFEMKQMRFSFLMVYWCFGVYRVFACHICLTFSSFNDSVRLFINTSFSLISYFIITVSSFSVYAGIVWWIYCSTSTRVTVKQAFSWLILLELSSFCRSNFFPKCSRVFVISSMTINNFLSVFVSFISKVGVLAFSDTDVDKSQLYSKNSIQSCVTT